MKISNHIHMIPQDLKWFGKLPICSMPFWSFLRTWKNMEHTRVKAVSWRFMKYHAIILYIIMHHHAKFIKTYQNSSKFHGCIWKLHDWPEVTTSPVVWEKSQKESQHDMFVYRMHVRVHRRCKKIELNLSLESNMGDLEVYGMHRPG